MAGYMSKVECVCVCVYVCVCVCTSRIENKYFPFMRLEQELKQIFAHA